MRSREVRTQNPHSVAPAESGITAVSRGKHAARGPVPATVLRPRIDLDLAERSVHGGTRAQRSPRGRDHWAVPDCAARASGSVSRIRAVRRADWPLRNPRRAARRLATAGVGELARELQPFLADRAMDSGRWRALYGMPPPRTSAAGLLVRRHRLFGFQEQALGGLDPVTRRRLHRPRTRLSAGRAPAAPRGAIQPGTRLLREWQDVMHEVIVLEPACSTAAKSWPSLSAVAR